MTEAREADRWRSIGGDELLEQNRLGGCFCCRWQAAQGPHVETITRQTLPDNIIQRLGHVSQTLTDCVCVCVCPASLCDFVSLQREWEAKTKRTSTQTQNKEISTFSSLRKRFWDFWTIQSHKHTNTGAHTQIPLTISSMLFSQGFFSPLGISAASSLFCSLLQRTSGEKSRWKRTLQKTGTDRGGGATRRQETQASGSLLCPNQAAYSTFSASSPSSCWSYPHPKRSRLPKQHMPAQLLVNWPQCSPHLSSHAQLHPELRASQTSQPAHV